LSLGTSSKGELNALTGELNALTFCTHSLEYSSPGPPPPLSRSSISA
jgi:hypothetical protein